jgi:hypothetical protein
LASKGITQLGGDWFTAQKKVKGIDADARRAKPAGEIVSNQMFVKARE